VGDERPTFGSLFAGIGGIDLGLERAGWRGRWQVEYEPFCQRVLAKHWPDVTRYGDIHDVDWDTVERVDLVAGGFPCQPISTAGRQRAQEDARWLWPEFARCLRALRPRYVLVENVANLLGVNDGSAFGEVLGDLATLGYDAEWDCIPAYSVGAPHIRDRLWIVGTEQSGAVADPGSSGRPLKPALRAGRNDVGWSRATVEYADSLGQGWSSPMGSPNLAGVRQGNAGPEPDGASARTVPDTDGLGREGKRSGGLSANGDPSRGYDADRCGGASADADRSRDADLAIASGERLQEPRRVGRAERPAKSVAGSADHVVDAGWWSAEPDVGRVAHGVPARVDRLRALGNAVVPQVVEFIGRRILEAEALT
jgi:DNA (cytosine-5)-methyltransferase 1